MKKFKIAFTLCAAMISISAAGCAGGAEMSDEETAQESGEDEAAEEDTAEAVAETAAQSDAASEESSIFYDRATKYYGLSEEETEALFQRVSESGILDGGMKLTGCAFGDYDENGVTDMIVCLYDDREDANGYEDGCLYLFMSEDEPYYIYDDFCCYWLGAVYGDFGADIDADGNTELVFCIQGTGCGGAGDCQKFVLKYRADEKTVERMELPDDLEEEYDSGLTVEIEKDTEQGVYRAYCPYLDDTIIFGVENDEDDWSGGNCRGYFLLDTSEYDGGTLLTGYEYLYAGAIVNGVGSAAFVFDWDENGAAYVKDWYIEAWDGNVYVSDKASGVWEADASFEETGEEITAYEEFLEGARTAVMLVEWRTLSLKPSVLQR